MFLMKGSPMGQNLIVEAEAHCPGNSRSPAFSPIISRLMATGDGYPPDLARREEKSDASFKDLLGTLGRMPSPAVLAPDELCQDACSVSHLPIIETLRCIKLRMGGAEGA